MRIVLATTATSPGGTWRHIRDLGGELQRGGHEVVIGLTDQADSLRQAAQAIGLPCAPWQQTVRWRGWLWHAHLHDTYERRIAVAAGIRHGIGPTILTEHLPRSNASDPALLPGGRHPLASPAKTAFKRAQFGLADAVIAVSPSSAAFLVDRYALGDKSVHTVINGLPAVPIPGRTLARESVSVISTGSVIHQKGHETLVLAAARPESRWSGLVVGDGRLRVALTALAHAQGAAVRFAGWVDAIDARLGEHDIACLPSRWESCPYAALEAMAAGLPLVASRVDGLRDLVLNGETGVLVAPGDPTELAGALARLAGDPVLRARMGHAARARAEEFTLARMGAQTLEVYATAADTWTARRGRRGVPRMVATGVVRSPELIGPSPPAVGSPPSAPSTVVDVLIVSYNCRDVLAECLASIARHRPADRAIDLRTHVFDNGSTDGTPGMVVEHFTDVDLHCGAQNRGFAAANNALAQRVNGDYLLLLNPDTVWHEDIVTPLLDELRTRPDAVLAAPRLVYPDGRGQLSSQRFPTLRYELAQALNGTKLRRLPGGFDAARTIDGVRGTHAQARTGIHDGEFIWATCWLLRSAWVAEHGLFDARLPLYDEDLEFCERLRRRGARALYVPEVELEHIGGVSSDPARKQILMQDARARYYALSRGRTAAATYRIILALNRFRLHRQPRSQDPAPSGADVRGALEARVTTTHHSRMTELEIEPQTPAGALQGAVPATAPDTPPRRPSVVRRRSLAAVASVVFIILVAAGTYLISDGLTKSYASSSELSVNVAGSSGVGQDSVLASNDLTAQYVQLLQTSSVLAAPAQRLGISVGKLQSEISVGSVAQQNLLQITARAAQASEAQRIAGIVAQHFVAYIARTNRQTSKTSTRSLSAQLGQVDRRITALTQQLGTSTTGSQTGNNAASLTSLYGALLSEQQTLRSSIAQHTVSNVVSLRTVVGAGTATQVAPKPKLYALVAALVALFICLQLVVLGDRRRRTRRV